MTIPTFAQVVDGNDLSPYSQIGIGDPQPDGFVRNWGMGGTGVANPSKHYINIANPALLPENKLTIFEFGLQARLRLLNATDQSQRNFGGSFSYVAIALPISKKVTIAMGFRPYSTVRYNQQYTVPIAGDTNTYSVGSNGQGNISQFFISGGYAINERWSAGFGTSFMFGNISDENSIFTSRQIITGFSHNLSKTVLQKNYYLNGYTLQGGLAYQRPIWKEGMKLTSGFVITYGGAFNATSSASLQKRTVSNGSENIVVRDTLNFSNNKFSLPTVGTLGVGLSMQDIWNVGMEIKYAYVPNKEFRSNNNSQNSVMYSVGGEFFPIYLKKKGFIYRMVYRLGAYTGSTPYVVNGTSINDSGFTIGFGVPLSKLFSYINIDTQIGVRGTTANGLIQENYFRFNLGCNINDRWFVRPKVD